MATAYKISKKLYRVRCDNGKVKDVWIAFGKIKPPTNPYNTLTETEKQLVEKELKDE